MHHNDRNKTSTSLINKNNFSYLDRFTPKKNQKFGRGHIVHQYMSSVGVITERYVSDEDLLSYKTTYGSDGPKSRTYVKSNSILNKKQEEMEEEELSINVPVNCPCYEIYLKEYYKKHNSLNIFQRLFK